MRTSRPIVAVLTIASCALLTTPAQAGVACNAHGRGRLTGFAPDSASPFYSALEGQGVTAVITVTGGDCAGEPAQVTYATAEGTATAPEDYAATSGTTGPLCLDSHPEFCGVIPATADVSMSTVATPDDEASLRSFWFRLTDGTRGLGEPAAAAVHIVEDGGPPRGSFEPTVDGTSAVAYSRSETFSLVRVPVFLGGSGSEVSFSIQPDPAAPAMPEEDYRVLTPSPLSSFASGVGFIDIALVNDAVAEQPESISLMLTSVAGGSVVEPSSTTVTILDNEENVFPVSRFHHPRQNWKYNKADYRIREFHIFATDEGGSGVVAAEMALRRNLASGKCAWKTRDGWQKKDCDNKTWLSTKFDDTGGLFYYRMPQLKSSVGTRIKDYTAFGRAIDGAGNVEKDFGRRRNMNTFEIRRKGKTQKA
jgi:hypothetical protein